MDIDAPYKSRLFNFLNRQMLLGLDRLGRAARQVRVAAIWSAQILVYPLYLTVQSSRLLGQKASEKTRETFKKLSPFQKATQIERDVAPLPPPDGLEVLSADLPIRHLLQVLSPRPREAIARSGLAASAPEPAPLALADESAVLAEETGTLVEGERGGAIQGIASDLGSRHLVLVGADNQIFDILAPEQQEQLRQRIVWEIANWHREGKALQEAQFALRVPSDAASDARVFPPARWFWRAMGWMQRSPVAISINLFQESTLTVARVPAVAPLPPEPPPLTFAPAWITLLEPLDRTVADLEVKLEENEIVRAIADTPVPVGWLEDLNIPLPVPQPSPSPQRQTEAEIWTIQTLLRAAIDYFFGRSANDFTVSEAAGRPSLHQNPRERPRSPLSGRAPQQPLTGIPAPSALPPHADIEADLWLSWDDLYGEEVHEKFAEDPVNFSVPARLVAAPPIPRIKDTPPEPPLPPLPLARSKTHPSSRPARRPEEKSLVRVASESLRAQQRRPYPEPSPLTERNSAPEETEDWLEVEATPTGYVKHPLEQILEWLDRLMLLLEELFLFLWRWIARRFR